MLILLAAAVVHAPSATPTVVSPFMPEICTQRVVRTAGHDGALSRKLGELPPGFATLAVDKRLAGCPVHVLPRVRLDGEHVMVPAPGLRRVELPTGALQPQRGLQGHRQR